MRILYVEDNAHDSGLVRHALLRSPQPPLLLEIVPTLAAARAALVEPLRFDVVLTDLNLPDGNGLELLADIRGGGLPLAVVTLTGQGDEGMVVAALKAGADDYLTKAGHFAERIDSTLRLAWDRHRDQSERRRRPLRVLYVEPNANDVALTRRHLETHATHIQIDCVVDAAAALQWLPLSRDAPTRCEVLLLDFRLPGDSGLDLLKSLRQDHGLDLPVVLVTGQGDEDVAALAMRLGATDYVVKHSNYLVALPAVLENAFHRVQSAREQKALRVLNASLGQMVSERTAELHAAMRAAEEANRSKSDFLARMSHDLRTPLNAVLGFSQLLALNPAVVQVDGAGRQLQLIHDAGAHLLAMIDELLDLVRIESGALRLNLEPLDVGPLVQECIALVSGQAEHHRIGLAVSPIVGARQVLADRMRLRQVLVNLLTNAIKYNRTGGRVDVDVSRHGGAVRLAVTDSGRGMTPLQLAGLFQPFNRLGAERSDVEGTGLGLVIAKQLMDLMHGSVEVSSVVGVGSTFTLTLPGADGPAIKAASPPPPAPTFVPSSSDQRCRVLYVEDNTVNATLMQDLMTLRPGVELVVAEDGAAALRLATDWKPHVVLLDLDLPGMSGIELLGLLRAEPTTATVPCIAVSAIALEPEIQKAMDQGCVDYLTKPLDVHRLFELLEKHSP